MNLVSVIKLDVRMFDVDDVTSVSISPLRHSSRHITHSPFSTIATRDNFVTVLNVSHKLPNCIISSVDVDDDTVPGANIDARTLILVDEDIGKVPRLDIDVCKTLDEFDEGTFVVDVGTVVLILVEEVVFVSHSLPNCIISGVEVDVCMLLVDVDDDTVSRADMDACTLLLVDEDIGEVTRLDIDVCKTLGEFDVDDGTFVVDMGMIALLLFEAALSIRLLSYKVAARLDPEVRELDQKWAWMPLLPQQVAGREGDTGKAPRVDIDDYTFLVDVDVVTILSVDVDVGTFVVNVEDDTVTCLLVRTPTFAHYWY
ncbi:hypothetical protein ISN45_At02g002020 [Arabidopsis thaliana x Arabidopsis arenosa]|uniref:Uncharacterized protein n=1 Tax=Arabidopsis thaliana x Arabidopsis arenosa TaxID=1240361 RepID=A0A8T2FLB5_9BRAS|nr:hypothetical protein ISN45_At02g002020 [Arabidopsis thaliana x Arabidopsis arenosa]